MKRIVIAWMVVAALSMCVACRDDEPSPPNLVFVLADTLRADHLTSYGDSRNPTPHIAAFAAESVVFENTTSQASCTFPSMNSMLTSRYPGEFLVQPDKDFGIPDSIPSLPAILAASGYSTHAVSASPIVRKSPSRFNETGGFGAGFDSFDERCAWNHAGCVNAAVNDLWKRLEPPFALYLHYLEPHAPYQPPSFYPRRFAGAYEGGKDYVERGDPRPVEKRIYTEGSEAGLDEQDVAHLKNLYADEIGFFDGSFGWLVEALRERDLLDNTIVVLLSDHGEGFLEHGDVHHCHTVYETSVHTPFLMRLPRGESAGRFAGVVQNLDVLPTLLDFLGIDATSYDFAGRSLRPLIEGQPGEPQPAFSGQGVHRSVRDARYKLIYDTESQVQEFYDLQEDPGEEHDLADQRSEAQLRLRAALDDWMAKYEPSVEAGSETNAGRGLEGRLRELGYLE